MSIIAVSQSPAAARFIDRALHSSSSSSAHTYLASKMRAYNNLHPIDSISQASGTSRNNVELAKLVDLPEWKRHQQAKIVWTSKGTLHPDFYGLVFVTENGEEVLSRSQQAAVLHVSISELGQAKEKLRQALDRPRNEVRLTYEELARLASEPPAERHNIAPYAWLTRGRLATDYRSVADAVDETTGLRIMNDMQIATALRKPGGARKVEGKAPRSDHQRESGTLPSTVAPNTAKPNSATVEAKSAMIQEQLSTSSRDSATLKVTKPFAMSLRNDEDIPQLEPEHLNPVPHPFDQGGGRQELSSQVTKLNSTKSGRPQKDPLKNVKKGKAKNKAVEWVGTMTDEMVYYDCMGQHVNFSEHTDVDRVVLPRNIIYYVRKKNQDGAIMATLEKSGGTLTLLLLLLNDVAIGFGHGKFFLTPCLLPDQRNKVIHPADFVYVDETWSQRDIERVRQLTPVQRVELYQSDNLPDHQLLIPVRLILADTSNSSTEAVLDPRPLASVVLLMLDWAPHLMWTHEFLAMCKQSKDTVQPNRRDKQIFKLNKANLRRLENMRVRGAGGIIAALTKMWDAPTDVGEYPVYTSEALAIANRVEASGKNPRTQNLSRQATRHGKGADIERMGNAVVQYHNKEPSAPADQHNDNTTNHKGRVYSGLYVLDDLREDHDDEMRKSDGDPKENDMAMADVGTESAAEPATAIQAANSMKPPKLGGQLRSQRQLLEENKSLSVELENCRRRLADIIADNPSLKLRTYE